MCFLVLLSLAVSCTLEMGTSSHTKVRNSQLFYRIIKKKNVQANLLVYNSINVRKI